MQKSDTVHPRSQLIRTPAVAGMFYPGNPTTLGKEIDALLARARVESPKGLITGMILPHAGYPFSGLAAALGYKLLARESVDCVAIVSPSHREYFNGISVYDGSAYRTPLGDLLVDEEARAKLVDGDPIIEASGSGHRDEHAIEVHLPFIQRVLGDVRILPIVMGDQRREYCFHLGRRLGEIFEGKRTLCIASSDLSHYHPAEEAQSLDRVIIADLSAFDVGKMMADLETNRTEACGGGPMVAVLAAARTLGADRAEILCHCNSGDVTGDRSSVVGYLSAVLLNTN
jgi:MEMO1 family protein